jgi:chemotaxis regulatin CheY-phosphate phosphatase CheZ
MAKTQKLKEKGEETLAAAKEKSSEVAQRVEKGAKKAADAIKTSVLPSLKDGMRKAAEKMEKATSQLMEKAEETARIARLKLSIRDHERQIEEAYARMGKTVWEMTARGEKEFVKHNEIKKEVDLVSEHKSKIKEIEGEIRTITEKPEKGVKNG